MKKNLFILVLMLLTMVVSASAAVEIDGIYYDLDYSFKTAAVTSHPNYYSGDVVIPDTVTFRGTNYSVTDIRCRETTAEISAVVRTERKRLRRKIEKILPFILSFGFL